MKKVECVVWIVGGHRIIHGSYKVDKGYLIHDIKEKGKWINLSKRFYPLFADAEHAAKETYQEIKNRGQMNLF